MEYRDGIVGTYIVDDKELSILFTFWYLFLFGNNRANPYYSVKQPLRIRRK